MWHSMCSSNNVRITSTNTMELLESLFFCCVDRPFASDIGEASWCHLDGHRADTKLEKELRQHDTSSYFFKRSLSLLGSWSSKRCWSRGRVLDQWSATARIDFAFRSTTRANYFPGPVACLSFVAVTGSSTIWSVSFVLQTRLFWNVSLRVQLSHENLG